MNICTKIIGKKTAATFSTRVTNPNVLEKKKEMAKITYITKNDIIEMSTRCWEPIFEAEWRREKRKATTTSGRKLVRYI